MRKRSCRVLRWLIRRSVVQGGAVSGIPKNVSEVRPQVSDGHAKRACKTRHLVRPNLSTAFLYQAKICAGNASGAAHVCTRKTSGFDVICNVHAIFLHYVNLIHNRNFT